MAVPGRPRAARPGGGRLGAVQHPHRGRPRPPARRELRRTPRPTRRRQHEAPGARGRRHPARAGPAFLEAAGRDRGPLHRPGPRLPPRPRPGAGPAHPAQARPAGHPGDPRRQRRPPHPGRAGRRLDRRGQHRPRPRRHRAHARRHPRPLPHRRTSQPRRTPRAGAAGGAHRVRAALHLDPVEPVRRDRTRPAPLPVPDPCGPGRRDRGGGRACDRTGTVDPDQRTGAGHRTRRAASGQRRAVRVRRRTGPSGTPPAGSWPPRTPWCTPPSPAARRRGPARCRGRARGPRGHHRHRAGRRATGAGGLLRHPPRPARGRHRPRRRRARPPP